MSHTPGPWDWLAVGANASGGHHLYLIDSTGRKIGVFWGKAEEKEANARLTVAAPEAIDLLTAIVDCYGMGGTPERFCKNVAGFIEEGRALLEKIKERT